MSTGTSRWYGTVGNHNVKIRIGQLHYVLIVQGIPVRRYHTGTKKIRMMVWYGIDFSRRRAFISAINFYIHTDYHREYRRERILVSKFSFGLLFGKNEEDKR